MWSPLVKETLRRVKSVVRDKRDAGWRVSNVLWGTVVAVLLVSTFALAWQKFQRPAVVEYDGQIVDRWAGFTDSDTGARAYYKLLVEDDGGKRVTVVVDNEIYLRAKVGMRIRRSISGIELNGKPAQSAPIRPVVRLR